MDKSRKLISGACLVTMDDETGILPQADILIEGGRIAALGPGLEAADAERIDGADAIVMPGLIDTHRHVWQAAMRAVTVDWSLRDYVRGIRFRAAGLYRPQDMYASQLTGALEALEAGVTTLVDYSHNVVTPDHARESVRGLQDAGIRALWCYGFNAAPTEEPFFSDSGERVVFLKELAAEQFNSADSLITLGVAPEEPGLTTPEITAAQFAAARELGARISLHLNCVRGADLPGEAAALASQGLLGPDLLLVHMGFSSDEEWSMVADSGCSVSSTPETELQMGMGVPLLGAMRRFGIEPTFGADIVSNNSGDMFFPLRLALQVERGLLNEKTLAAGEMPEGAPIEVAEALRWGTVNGARACGLDRRIGSLSVGKDADLIMLRSEGVNLAAWNRDDPQGAVLLQAHPGNVDSVMVAGNFVKRGGRLCANVTAARRAVEDSREYIARCVAERGGFRVDPEEMPLPF